MTDTYVFVSLYIIISQSLQEEYELSFLLFWQILLQKLKLFYKDHKLFFLLLYNLFFFFFIWENLIFTITSNYTFYFGIN